MARTDARPDEEAAHHAVARGRDTGAGPAASPGRRTSGTHYIRGAADGVSPPAVAASVPRKFAGLSGSVQLPGLGHFPQCEAPAAVADHSIALFTRSAA